MAERKRIVALFLAILMIMQMLPVNVLAAGIEGYSTFIGATYAGVRSTEIEFQVAQTDSTGAPVVDANGNITYKTLTTQLVIEGEPEYPDIPDVQGYKTIGWGEANGNVIKAVYEKLETITVRVDFKYTSGEQARESLIYDYEKGTGSKLTVKPDVLDGFNMAVTKNGVAVQLDGNGSFEIDVPNLTADEAYLVTYSGKVVNYTVNHHVQNTKDANYTTTTETKSGTAGTKTAAGLMSSSNNWEGFTVPTAEEIANEQRTIAPDGSTVIDFYYNRNTYNVTYVTNGGSPLLNEVLPYGYEIVLPEITRLGYTLTWKISRTDNNTELATGLKAKETYTMPAYDLTIEAVWAQPETANYTIMYWVQGIDTLGGTKNLVSQSNGSISDDDKHYEYLKSVSQSGRVGTTPNATTLQTSPNSHGLSTTFYSYNANKSEVSATIAADGSTVYHVRFDRAVIKFTFEDAVHVNSGYWGYDEDLIMYGLYGQTFAQNGLSWPSGRWTDRNGLNQSNWTYLDGFNHTQLSRTDVSFYKNSSNGSKDIYQYIETLDSTPTNRKWKEADHYENGANNFTVTGKFEPAFSLYGYIKDNGSMKTSDFNSVSYSNNIKVYNTRNSFTLSYANCGTVEPTTYKYEAPLVKPTFTVTPPAGVDPEQYEFGGWYHEPAPASAQVTPVNWGTETMPAANKIVYAKWVPKVKTVTYHYNDGKTADKVFNVYAGDTLSEHHYSEQGYVNTTSSYANRLPSNLANPFREDYVFDGWYMDEACTKPLDVSFATAQITKNYDVFAKWVSTKIGSAVGSAVVAGGSAIAGYYENGEWVSIDNIKMPTAAGRVGETVYLVAPEIPGYEPIQPIVSHVLTAGEVNTVYIPYRKLDIWNLLVRYEDLEGNEIADSYVHDQLTAVQKAVVYKKLDNGEDENGVYMWQIQEPHVQIGYKKDAKEDSNHNLVAEVIFKYEKVYQAPYKTEHYKWSYEQNNYVLADTTTGLKDWTGFTVQAEANTYANYHLVTVEGMTVSEGVVKKDGTLTLKLYYEPDTFKVTYAYEPGAPTNSSPLPGEEKYAYGSTVDVEADATAAGYTFTGWYTKDGALVTVTENDKTFKMPAADVTLYGKFDRVMTTISGAKTWSGEPNGDTSYRPQNITVQLFADGVAVEGKQITLSSTASDQSWTWTVPTHTADGKAITYTVREMNGETAVADNGELPGSKSAKYTVKYSATDLDIENNLATADYVVNYYEQGTTNKLYESKSVEGKTVNSKVVEKAVTITGWTLVGDASQELTIKPGKNEINFYYTRSTKQIEVTKIWEDSDNQDGFRPTTGEFTVALTAGDEASYSITGAYSDSTKLGWSVNGKVWTGKVTVLTHTAKGEALTYTVTESISNADKSAKYAPLQGGSITPSMQNSISLTNSHEAEAAQSIAVEKKWNDAEYSERPESVTVTLYENGTSTGKTLTLNEANGWKGTFTGMPKYVAGKQGVLAQYTVVETALAGYTATYSPEEANQSSYTITNTIDQVMTSVIGTKKWAPVANVARPKVWLQLWSDEVTDGTQASTSKIIELDGTVDENGEKEAWKAEFTSLNTYAYGTDGSARVIDYTVREVDASGKDWTPNGYTKDTDNTDLQVTNTYNAGEGKITVVKRWVTPEGMTNPTATLKLNRKVGSGAGEVVGNPFTTNANDEYTFTGLEEFAPNGEAYTYYVTEDSIDEYTAYVGGTALTADGVVAKLGGTVTVVNKSAHLTDTADIVVTKNWDDDSNYANIRPSKEIFWVKLTGDSAITPTEYIVQNKAAAEGAEAVQMWDGNENTWTYTFDDVVRKYDDQGNIINYTVSEYAAGNYVAASTNTSSITPADNDSTVSLKNSYAPGKVTVTVQKVWVDNNNEMEIRPASVTAVLKNNNGDPDCFEELNEGNNWSASWTVKEFKKNSTTEKITYTVEESGLNSDNKLPSLDTANGRTYSAEVKKTNEDGYAWEITNTHDADADKSDIVVTKQWKNGETVNTAPDAATVKVKLQKSIDNGTNYVDVAEGTMNIDNGTYKYIWKNQNKYEKVDDTWVVLKYRVVEIEAPTGWEIGEIDGVEVGSDYTATITNNRAKSDPNAYPVQKVWYPADDADKFGITVTVMRKANNVEERFKVVTLTAEDTNWTEYLGAVETHDVNGNPYEYYIEPGSETYANEADSAKLDWYTATYDDLTVTNKRKTTSATVTKSLPTGSADGDKFQFEYFIDDVSKDTFWLDANTLSKQIDNLNVGDKLTVKEIKTTQSDETTDVTYYTVDYGEHENQENTAAEIANLSATAESNAITVTNTREPVTSMTLKKIVSDSDHNADQAFNFKYRVNGGEWQTVPRTHADGPVKLTDGLYVGDKVEIAEIEDVDYVFPATTNVGDKTKSTTIGTDQVTLITIDQIKKDNAVVFTNNRKTSGLTVSKTVIKPATTGIDGTATGDAVNTDASTEFTFALKKGELVEANAAYTIGTSTELKYTDSNGQFKLKDGETATFTKLEVGTYTVTETDESDWTVVGEATKSATVATDSNASISFTNTRDTKADGVTVQKIWKDNSNAYGTRPDSITLRLIGKAGEATVYTANVTLSGDGDTWSKTIENLPATHEGTAIVYDTVVEETEPALKSDDKVTTPAAGATVTAATKYTKKETGLTVTNSLTGSMTLQFTKTWTDDSNKFSRRPTREAFAEMLTLTSSPKGVESTPAIAESGNPNVWTITFTDLPIYTINGVKYEYTLTEALTGNTAAWYDATDAKASWSWAESELELENTLKKAAVTITKQIVDETDLADANREFDITYSYTYTGNAENSMTEQSYQIPAEANEASLKNGETTTTWNVPVGGMITVTENADANVWATEWTNATAVSGDDKQAIADVNGDLAITLTNTRTTVPVNGTKIWPEGDNEHPAEITLTVARKIVGANEYTAVGTAAVTPAEDGSFTITEVNVEGKSVKKLAEYDDQGNKFTYIINGEAPNTNYYPTFNETTNVTNAFQTGSFTLTKTGSAGALLNGAEFKLYAKTEAGYDADIQAEAKYAQTTENGVLTFTGIAIGEYWLVETKAPDGYDILVDNNTSVSVTGNETNESAATVTIGGIVTNTVTKVNDLTDAKLTLKKTVTDNTAYDNGSENAFGFTVKLTNSKHKGYTVMIGEMAYADSDKDGIVEIPADVISLKHTESAEINGIPLDTVVTITELADANVWSTEWDKADEGATDKVATVTISSANNAPEVVAANTRILLNVDGELRVTKVWNDHSNLYGTRPDSVTMQLWAKAGETKANVTELAKTLTGTEDQWTATWNNLPAYSLDGEAYTYDVKEADVTDGILSGKLNASYTMTDDADYGLADQTITNTMECADLTVEKRVVDPTGEKADSEALYFGFQVKDAAGSIVTDAEGKRVVYIKHGESATFKGMPIGATYTVEEIGVYEDAAGKQEIENGLNAWTITADANDDVTIAEDDSSVTYTNTRILLDNNGELTFTKKWDDESNKFGNRPTKDAFIEMLTLYYNSSDIMVNDSTGVKKVPTISGEGDSWTIKYEDLAKFDLDGSPYNYTLTEVLDTDTAKWYQAVDASVTWLADGTAEDLELNNRLLTQDIVINKLWQQPNVTQVSANAYGDTEELKAEATLTLYAVTTAENALNIEGVYMQGEAADEIRFANVPVGNYVVKESGFTNTDNYDVSDTVISVNWDAESQQFVYNTKDTNDGNKTITNLLKHTTAENGALTITKDIQWKNTADKGNVTFDIGYAYKLPDGAYETGTIKVDYDADKNAYTYSSKENVGKNVFVNLPYGTTVTFTESPNAAWKPSMSGDLDAAVTPVQNADTKVYTISGDVTVSADKKAVEVRNTRVMLNEDNDKEDGKIKVTKVWNTKFDKPESIDVQLLWNLTLKETKPLSANWTAEFTDLPAYDLKGQQYTYTVLEAKSEKDTYKDGDVITLEATDGNSYSYDVRIVGTQAEGAFTITNTYKAPTKPEKTADTATGNLGQVIKYVIERESTYNVESAAVITDTLPKGLTYNADAKVSVAAEGGEYAETSAVVTPTGETDGKVTISVTDVKVPALGKIKVEYTATVNVDAIRSEGTLTNNVNVQLGNEPTGDFQKTEEVVETPILSIAKTVDKTVVRTNDTVTYTITVTNSGKADADAKNVEIADVIPEGLSDIKVNGVPAEMDEDRVVKKMIPVVAAGSSETVTITAKVTALTGTISKNLVTITGENDEPTGETLTDPDNPDTPFKDETDPLTVQNPKLTITKTAEDESEETDLKTKEFAFELSGGSNGIAGVKYTKGEASGLMTDGKFNLKHGESITFELPIDVTEGASTIYTIDENETAWNLTYNGDAADADQKGTVTFTADANGETVIEVVANNVRKMINEDPDDPDDNDQDDGKLKVTKVWLEANGVNTLTSHIADETVKVNLYRSSSAEEVTKTPLVMELTEAANWAGIFEKLPATDAQGNTYTYTVKEVDETDDEKAEGDKAMFATATAGDLFFEVTINQENTAEGYTITNKLKDREKDPETTKTADKEEAEIDDVITYTITDVNPYGTTTTATITDTLPNGIAYNELVSVEIINNGVPTESEYEFVAKDQILTWTIKNVPPMSSVKIVFKAKVTEDAVQYDELTNKATISREDGHDSEFKSDEGTVDVDTLVPDLEMIKTLVPEKVAVEPGETITYRLTVKNTGNGRATGVVVTDYLPEQVVAKLDDSQNLTLSEEGTQVIWNVGVVEAGQEVSVEFAVIVKSDEELDELEDRTQIINNAKITEQPPKDPNDPDASDEDEVITPIFRVEIDKTSRVIPAGEYPDADNDPNTASLGDIIEFKVTVKNLGGIAADNIVVEDLMLGKAIDKNIVVSELVEKIMIMLNLEENQLILPKLEPGKKVEFTYQYKVTEADILAGSVNNVATVTAQNPDSQDDPIVESDETKNQTDPATPSMIFDKAITNDTGKPYGFKKDIAYMLTITNTGNVSLTDVVIVDDMTSGADPEDRIIELEKPILPGETVTVEYTYTVQDGDLRPTYKEDGVTPAEHPIDNKATVTAMATNDEVISVEDTAHAMAEQWYHIIFVDSRTNEVIEYIDIPYGGRVFEVPEPPYHRGYDFIRWTDWQGENITFNQVVYALYERDTETIFDARIPLAGGYISNVGDCFD